jgi:hypothetical protein
MCTCGCETTIQEIDESDECWHKRMRSLGIREAQEAMEAEVSLRAKGYADSTA